MTREKLPLPRNITSASGSLSDHGADRRHLLATGLAGGMASLLLPSHFSPLSAQEETPTLSFFRIGTGPSAETLYSLGTAISAGISRPPGSSPCDEGGICGVPGLIAVAQTRAGSIPNIRDIRDGVLESALVHADMAYWAFTGGGPFADETSVPDLRVIADLIPVSLHIVVRADSGIDSIRDLKGRTVSFGARGAGTATIVNTLLRLNGLNLQDVKPLYLRPGPAADHLITGVIDAFFEMGAAPIDAIRELQQEEAIKLLTVDGAAQQTLKGFFPFLSAGEIPKDTYHKIDTVSTVKLGVKWVVKEKMDFGLIESITRALWQSSTADLFNHNNPGLTFPTVEQGRPKGLVPVHPGAQAYYDTVHSS
ncbi:MAG: TAXI family TRAP transporter solute-binding subunit [Alphaproteobacteria bacterium]|nr:TAXI family TRAP transporter solute-binding subunit [Alphaproteobacteria bacterium]